MLPLAIGCPEFICPIQFDQLRLPKPAMTKPKPANALPLSSPDGQSLPEPEVPVFRCVVYLSRTESGQVHAVVANLADLQVTAGSERSALQRIVPAFKKRVIQFKQEGKEIPWIDPPTAIRPDQDKRVVPIHL